ncbi:ras-like protein 1 [Daphnia pulex]|uniref:ras-like protein 1 n=1 Tax=Daphnia pulex TaxID=6669 RepID=UPI001EE00D52|nr:ras-like protein 1 [Daphnia pulex]XP_046446069.1 ras-like protein 1 [Daphnia pulex]
MASPPKHQQHPSDSPHCNKLVNRLNLATLSLRPRWRVMVLGHHSVGKSAFVVRFLTRRFIGDYDPKLERCYPVNTTLNGEHVMLELLDSGGHHLEDGSQSDLEAKIRWADAFVLLYSVTDKCSFDECCRLRFLIGYNKRRRRHLFGSAFGNGHGLSAEIMGSSSSVILVANKVDQVEDRMVTTEEGEKRSRDLGCDLFFEISVREEVEVAKRVMEDLYFRWKYNQSHHHQSHSPQTQQPHPPLGASTPNGTSNHHFGRRCLETFAGRCSANKSNSMDVISEREDGALPISLSLESPPPTATGNNSPDDKFRSRASTEGSLSFRNKRVIVRHCAQPAPVAQLDHPGLAVACNLANKRPTRRMSISLRGASSAF